MGIKWFLFRIKYYIKIKYGFFEKNDFKILNKKQEIDNFKIPKWLNIYSNDISNQSKHIDIADNAINGRIFVFSNEYMDFGNPKKWCYNPLKDVKIDNNIHWSRLPDFGQLGDIKIPWELSRFSHFYSYIKAHKITKNKKYIDAFICDVEGWLEQNKFPNGINYKCGQEMTFRIFSILISVNYFYEYLDDKFFKKIGNYLVLSGYRIEENIDYAVISVKNDHAISESIGLIISGLLFKNRFKDANRWFKLGKKILLNELDKQVYADGSYLCHSFNYQREILDELTFLLLILKNNFYNEKELIDKLIGKNKKMIVFLNSFIQDNGWLPNYGSNDGANLFPVLESDYRDYRTSLNFASAVCMGEILYDRNLELLELFNIVSKRRNDLIKKIEFNDGGYYILKNKDIFSFIRCHSYKDRPAQNDMFHLDVWYKGKNIFCDSGSYSYNTDKKFKNNFIGIVGHNTVMINDTNQMAQVLNFGYSNWTKAKKLSFDKNHFLGENYAYKKEFGIVQKRGVDLEDNKLIIIDHITNISTQTNIKQIWNTKYKVEVVDKYSLKVDNCIITSNIKYKLEKSYISDYYNSYIIGTRIVFEIDSKEDFKIETTMEFK
jgi:hypothetical protein